MNTSLNTIEGIESALSDLQEAIRQYMKSHGIDFAIEQTYTKQAEVLGMKDSIPRTKRLSLNGINKNHGEIIGMMGIEMCQVASGMEIILPPLHVIGIQNTRRVYEQFLRDGTFSQPVPEEGKKMFERMKKEGITAEQYEERATEHAEHMMRTEAWKVGGVEESTKAEGEELGFRVVNDAKFQNFIQGFGMIKPGEHPGIVRFIAWIAYILEEKMKYHFFKSVDGGTEDLLSVFGFLPQIVGLIKKHNLDGSKLEYYLMHMKRKTVREYAMLMQFGYDHHLRASEQPLIQALDVSFDQFVFVMKRLGNTLPEIEKNGNAKPMTDDAKSFGRSLIPIRQRRYPQEDLGELRKIFE